MSRIGKIPVEILKGVKTKFENAVLTIEGPKGKIEQKIPSEVTLDIKDGKIFVKQGEGEEKRVKAFHGLYRALIQNHIKGVHNGYEKQLEITGVGYRAKLEGKNIILSLGYSHQIKCPVPEGISVRLDQKDTLIILNGIDKHKIGQLAATIRGYYPPEPYKGKGIKYKNEHIKRKKGKRVA